MSNINVQSLIDKIASMSFELTEIYRMQALRTDLTDAQKETLSDDEYMICQRKFEASRLLCQVLEDFEQQGIDMSIIENNLDFSMMEMAENECVNAIELRYQRMQPIVID